MNKPIAASGSGKRIHNINGTLNFRDLGGYQTKDRKTVQWGCLYRSAQLDRLSERGITELVNLGIRTVIDLRFTNEINNYPTIKAAVPEAKIISWDQEKTGDSEGRSHKMQMSWRDSLESLDPKQVKEAMRVNYPEKLYSHAAIYRKMLLCIAEAKTPLLLHCAAGKDRTGVAAALILSLLNVSEETIIEDYLLTQSQLEGRIESWLAGGATNSKNNQDFQNSLSRYPKHVLAPIFSAEKAYITTLLDYVQQTYGSFEVYALEKLAIKSNDIDRIRSHLLNLENK